ncbi:MAG: DUF3800 domain-containing protein [bacterium]
MVPTRLYCYVDETGQDTKGKVFLVAIILKDSASVYSLEKKLLDIEQSTSKEQLKWKKTSNQVKIAYLEELFRINDLKHSIFYSRYSDSKEYPKLTSLTIAKAVLAKREENYSVTVIIDGLNNKEREIVRAELKRLKIKYRKIRGMKDEQSALLRLADTMAGFLRDITEEQLYTKPLLARLRTAQIVTEI